MERKINSKFIWNTSNMKYLLRIVRSNGDCHSIKNGTICAFDGKRCPEEVGQCGKNRRSDHTDVCAIIIKIKKIK